MSSATYIDLRVNNAEQFKESVSEPAPNTNLYICYGKSSAWANDAAPPNANSSISTVYEIWDNMIGGKRIVGGDISHVIPRRNWTANTKYVAYDHTNPNLPDGNTAFYAMNSTYSVYKCIANNSNSVSTVEPTSVSPFSVSATSDGYLWKYLYTLTDADLIRFATSEYIPVKTLSLDDGSLQWQVQDNATEGSIDSIVLTNFGTGYNNVSNITITITGDGSSASANATINTSSNTISSIVINDSGQDYTYATVTISDRGTGVNAAARAIISPPGGHGSDPLYELGGKDVMINGRFRYDENGVLPVTNDFRQIYLLKDPLESDSPYDRMAETTFLQATRIIVSGTDDYTQDEYVYQGSSLATSTFSGLVLSWDRTTSTLLLTNTRGTAVASQSLIGATSFTGRVIASVETGALKKFSGRILYVDNIKPVTRSSDQIEDFRLVMKF